MPYRSSGINPLSATDWNRHLVEDSPANSAAVECRGMLQPIPAGPNQKSQRAVPRGQSLVLPGAVICLLSLGVCASTPPDDAAPRLPFFIGERLTYDVTLAGGTRIGQGTMWVEGP